MNDEIAQQIADKLDLIAKALDTQNDHLRSIDRVLDEISDNVNYVGQGVMGLNPPPEEED